jgi:Flp pilus assembly protein TadB
MTSPGNRDEEIRRREKEIEERERALRLRELEAEINRPQPPLYETTKHQPSESSFQQWKRKLIRVGSFLGIVVGVVVAVRVASTLATVVMVGAIAFVIYKIFLDDRSKK